MVGGGLELPAEDIRIDLFLVDGARVAWRGFQQSFPQQVLARIGEPYISGRSSGGETQHMGLGIFIAQSLLERTGARVSFANMADGGKTPIRSKTELAEIGYKLALYPVMLLSSAIAAMQATLAALQTGSKTAPPPSVSFVDLQGIVGFPDYWDLETRYQAKD